MDKYCLVFKKANQKNDRCLDPNKQESSTYCNLSSDDLVQIRFLETPDNQDVIERAIKSRMYSGEKDKWGEIYYDIPTSFEKALTYI